MNHPHNEEAPTRLKKKNLWLALTLLLAILAAIGAVVFFAERLLFSRNERFLLRRIEVRSEQSGYWNGRDDRVAERLQLHPGRDNLWEMDLRQLREKLQRHPSIQSCTMKRVLPDTLSVSIVERLPRAALGHPGSPFLLSDDLVVLPRAETMTVAGDLPVLTGFAPNYRTYPGDLCPQAKAAMNLLMEILRNYPDFAAVHLDVSSRDKLKTTLRYRNRYLYQVTFPTDGRFDYLLGVVQSAIIALLRNGDDRHVLDISFNGQVVIRNAQ